MKKQKQEGTYEWYVNESKKLGVTARCPYASLELCPRYHACWNMLGRYGYAGIPEKSRKYLDLRWESVVYAEEVSPFILSEDRELKSLFRFCPEVTYESYGYFALSLIGYTDDIDIDRAYERLGDKFDPCWARKEFVHYTGWCKEYSILSMKEI